MNDIIIKSTNDNTLTIPTWLMTALNLHEGSLEQQLIRLTRQQTVSLEKLSQQLFELLIYSNIPNTVPMVAAMRQHLLRQDDNSAQKTMALPELHVDYLQQFLNLEGALADDTDFDQAIATLNEVWQTWPHDFV